MTHKYFPGSKDPENTLRHSPSLRSSTSINSSDVGINPSVGSATVFLQYKLTMCGHLSRKGTFNIVIVDFYSNSFHILHILYAISLSKCLF